MSSAPTPAPSTRRAYPAHDGPSSTDSLTTPNRMSLAICHPSPDPRPALTLDGTAASGEAAVRGERCGQAATATASLIRGVSRWSRLVSLNPLKIRNKASQTATSGLRPQPPAQHGGDHAGGIRGLVHDPAAVDAQQLTGDERAFRGAEEQHRAGDIARHAAPLDRLLVQYVAVVALAVRMDLLGGGRERPGCHGVDRDPVRAALASERPGEAHQRSLGGHVGDE